MATPWRGPTKSLFSNISILWYLSKINIQVMKDSKIIILTAFLAVAICLILTILLFFVVTPGFLFTMALTIRFVSGICVTSLIYFILHKIKIDEKDVIN